MNGYGEIIRRARKKKGLTQTALSQKIGVTKNAIYDWEKEKYQPANIANIKTLEAVLGFEQSYLLNLLYPNPPQPSTQQQ